MATAAAEQDRQQQQSGGKRAAGWQRQRGHSRAVFKTAVQWQQWQQWQSGGGGIRKHKTGCSNGGGRGNSAAAEVAATAAAQWQKAARSAGQQDSVLGRLVDLKEAGRVLSAC
jgi:hypothetical protein